MTRLSSREPDKKRFLSALRFEQCGEIPFFETEFAPGIVNQILGINSNNRSYLLETDDYIDLLTACGIDIMYVHVPYAPGRRETTLADGRKIFVDGNIKSYSDLKNFQKQDPEPVKKRIETLLEAASGTNIGWCYAFGGPSVVSAQIGYNDYYVKLFDDPGFIHEFLKRELNSILPVMEAVLSYDPDAVFVGVDTCFKTGIAMSFEMVEEFVLDYLRKRIKPALEKNIPVILHSDGDNTDLMDCWIDMGISALHPVEDCGEYNIFSVKEKWGDKIGLIGSIDCFKLANGTQDEIRIDTQKHLNRLSQGGGYICGSSHDIDDNININNLKIMIDTITG